MANELLTICIPTRNRSRWLERALARLTAEIEANHIGPEVLKIYVSDNFSSDDTTDKVRHFQTRLPHLAYTRQSANIGADSNINHCGQAGTGEYKWVMGDDDAIRTGALAYILECLRKHRPALFINTGELFACGFKTPKLFRSYREFALTCMQVNPQLLLGHSLITANIFRSACFDYGLAMAAIHTSYGHMHGMLTRMNEEAGGVFVTGRPTIAVRNSSMDPVDGLWPADMHKIWGDYLMWLKQQFDLSDCQREKIPEYIRRSLILQLKSQPFRTAWYYGRSLNHAQTWRSLWKLFN